LRFKLKRVSPGLLAVVVGLAVAVFAWNALHRQVTEARQTVRVVVPKHDIGAYSVVNASDLGTKEVPPSAVDGFTVRKAGEAAGKVATAPLYAGKPIDRRVLAEPSGDVGGRQVVGVNVDAARCAGVRAGDVVDVYWLRPEQGAWAPSQSAVLVARDVRVLKVCDERGQEVEGSPSVLQGAVGAVAAARKEPKVVYLLVKPEDVPKVIGGAAEKSAFIALARKSAPSAAETEQEVSTGAEVAEAEGGTGAGTEATTGG